MRSYGSWTTPSTSWSSTSGRETWSSKPSRRICSMSTASWSSPRPRTSKVSADAVGWTSMLTLPRTSRSRRARIWREVRSLPVAARQRRGVDAEGHPERRLVDREPRQRAGVGRVGDRVADGDLGQAGHRDDVARAGLLDLLALDAARARRQRGDLPVSVTMRSGSTLPSGASASSRTTVMRWPMRSRAVADPADGHPARRSRWR